MKDQHEYILPDQLRGKLGKQDWFPEWDFDVVSCERKLNKQGISLVEPAKRFLKKFGGLSLSDPQGHRVYLNPLRVLRVVYPEKILGYPDYINCRFSPVGEGDGGQTTILMTESEEFFFVRDDWVKKFARHPVSALEYFVNGHEQ